MRLRRFFILNPTLLFISFLILSGCSTTEPTSKIIQPPSEEIAKEIKLTEFIVGPGDTIQITVYRHDDLNKTAQIDTSGKITYPFIGDIEAGGLSVFQLRDKIRDGLSEYIKNPQVAVSVTAVKSQKVYVLGEVQKPGAFALNTPMSTIEAISSAGGFTIDAQDKSVMVIRGNKDNPQLIKLNLQSALKGGNLSQNIQLQAEDIVFIPPKSIADVSRYGIYLSRILWPLLWIGRGGVFVAQ
jgi:polysaccharide export outer membrane protein